MHANEILIIALYVYRTSENTFVRFRIVCGMQKAKT